ncbi:prostacyclin synthase-like isoform X1 [Entelurus aequoreus]|uniref:prostacyclin synthase-like isoform X1 n=2 Tax=Entelurus aequoreus TaxID=161455 RepID=UPI002B1E7AF4|nr:prostacyclin synthase-like isoform X1 [Entelurus aequoreus]
MPWMLFSLLIFLLLLVFLYCRRTRRKHEPPLDKGFIPWLGHALAFRRDTAKFLSEMKDKHGDVFTVCVAGQYVTVLLDPNSFDEVMKDNVHLKLSRQRQQLMENVFGVCLPNMEASAEKTFMKQHFQGVHLDQLDASMSAHLQELILHHQYNQSEWRQDGLFSLCYSLLFRAGYLSLFENKKNVNEVYQEFRKFDQLLSKMARRSLEGNESETILSSRRRLWELLSRTENGGRDERKSWQDKYQHFLQEEGVNDEMQTKAVLMQLWTTQCNAGPTAFWLLGFLLTHPEAMKALQSELRGLTLEDMSPQPPSTMETHSTPVFDSILKETLRLTAAALISREVVDYKILHMSTGQKYHLRPGDKVCLFPFLSPQMDPEIHQEPQTFKYDRFLDQEVTTKHVFYKDGRRLKYANLPWGAGSNVCVGKHFAITIIKKFVFLMLAHVDLQLCEPTAGMPPVNPSRYGYGIMQPDGDLLVKYRLKLNTL